MITGNAARLEAARKLLLRFVEIGRVTDLKKREALQRSPAGWPVSRDDLARQIRSRLDGRLPEQLDTSYCGPAAFLCCMIHDRPDAYVMYAVSLWERGVFRFTSGAATVQVDSADGEVPTARRLVRMRADNPRHAYVNDLDWMTMSCLSASTRPVDLGDVGPTDQAGSVTYPKVLRRWFVAAGSSVRADTMGLGLMKSAMFDTLSLMRFWADSWIVLQIDSSMLTGGEPNTMRNRHWVVVDPHHRPMVRKGPGGAVISMEEAARELPNEIMKRVVPGGDFGRASPEVAAEMMDGRHMADWDTDLRVVSWANERHPVHGRKLGQTIGRIYGGYAFARFS